MVPPVVFVKTIGDAVMLVSPDTTRLVEVVLELIDAAAVQGLPGLRAGTAAGLAVSRAGDWFGSPVERREPGHRPCAAGDRAGHRFCAAIQRCAGKSGVGAGRCSPPSGRARASAAFPGSSGRALTSRVRPLHARLSGHHLSGEQTTIDDVLSPGDESRVV